MRVPDDPAFLAYLAGFIDGEGNFIISSTRGRSTGNVSHFPSIHVTQCDRDILEWIAHRMGAGKVDAHGNRGGSNHRVCYRLKWHGRNAEAVAEALLPYLRVKRAQAEVLMELREARRDTARGRGARLTPEQITEREALKQKMNRLNLRGRAADVRDAATA